MTRDGHRYPDFIIAGAPRAATTWLWTLADRHPEIAMARPDRPEPKFFNVDELYERGITYYAQRWFDGLPAVRCYGEKSANYLESPHVPGRIRHCLPDVKLVFTLRNPIDRAYSNFLWSRQNGLEAETSFARALELEPEREPAYSAAMRFARPHSYFSRGLYAEHLARFMEFFPREHILVLRTEDAVARPDLVADRLHRFLGVEACPDVGAELGAINGVRGKTATLDPQIRRDLSARYAEPNGRLAELLGPTFELWPD